MYDQQTANAPKSLYNALSRIHRFTSDNVLTGQTGNLCGYAMATYEGDTQYVGQQRNVKVNPSPNSWS